MLEDGENYKKGLIKGFSINLQSGVFASSFG